MARAKFGLSDDEFWWGTTPRTMVNMLAEWHRIEGIPLGGGSDGETEMQEVDARFL